jgi:hypothetical protein
MNKPQMSPMPPMPPMSPMPPMPPMRPPLIPTSLTNPTFSRAGLALVLIATAAACGGKARGLDAYRTDTQNLLGTRSAQLESCYSDALNTDATLAGTVTVRFVVEKKTGQIKDATIDPATTAPDVLGQCVLRALDGLALAPADRNEGRAMFTYEFAPSAASS